jgi:hypothetical protein
VKINKKTRTALIVAGLAVAAYFAYRWYENKKGSGSSSTGLGSNLNSTLTSLNAGPQTNVNYYAGSAAVSTTTPVATTSPTWGRHGNKGHTQPAPTGGSSPAPNPSTGNGLLSWVLNGVTQSGTAAQFLAAFQSTGTNAGQIVPGGTGKKIPLKPGQSYTS